MKNVGITIRHGVRGRAFGRCALCGAVVTERDGPSADLQWGKTMHWLCEACLVRIAPGAAAVVQAEQIGYQHTIDRIVEDWRGLDRPTTAPQEESCHE